jgi:transposase-like protein
MAINDEILNQLMKGYEKPEDLLGKDGLFMEPKKALVERALAEELTHHLGYEKGGKPASIGHHLLKRGQALYKDLKAMAQPDAAHSAWRYEHAPKT